MLYVLMLVGPRHDFAVLICRWRFVAVVRVHVLDEVRSLGGLEQVIEGPAAVAVGVDGVGVDGG